MKRSVRVWPFVGGVVLAACSSGSTSGFGSHSSAQGGDDGGPTTTPTNQDASSGGGDAGFALAGGHDSGTGSGSGSGSNGACTYAKNDTTDHDGDGWSSADGDCNDCNKYINPGAYDVPGNGIDEDCSGKADDEPTGCDSALTSVATTDGVDGAKAMDLCRTAVEGASLPKKTWGVISADYVLPDGTSAQSSSARFQLGFGILGPLFGTSNKTQQGQHMLGLSSGTARQPTDPGYVKGVDSTGLSGGDVKGYTSKAPTGFPGTTQACPGVKFGAANDGAALRVVIRVPTNALTMSFDSDFFSCEFPHYVCSTYNDTFVVIMTPPPAGEPATANDNIAFDSTGNIISVNAGFLQILRSERQAGEVSVCRRHDQAGRHGLREGHGRVGPRVDRLADDEGLGLLAGGAGDHAPLRGVGLLRRPARHDGPRRQPDLDVCHGAEHRAACRDAPHHAAEVAPDENPRPRR